MTQASGRETSLVGILGLVLVPTAILLAALYLNAPCFGRVTSSFWRYLLVTWLCSPFVVLGFLQSIFLQLPLWKKVGLVLVTAPCTAFALWPLLSIVAVMMGGPINIG